MIIEPSLDSRAVLVKGAPGESLSGLDRAEVIRLFKERGLLLFRDFEVNSSLFCKFTQLYGESFGRIGGTLRASAGEAGSLFEVTEGDGDLDFHAELGHSPSRPDIIWFWCLQPAETGGETRLLDGSEFPDQLTRAERDCFGRNRLKYSHRMPEIMWKSFFGVETREDCATYLSRAEGVRDVSFNGQGVLTFKYLVPAIRKTKFGGLDAFANSILILTRKYEEVESGRPLVFSADGSADAPSFSMSVAFEDGSEIPRPLLERVREITERLSFSHELGHNEILMLDNTRFSHARRGFRGRRIILSRYALAAFT